MKTLYVSLCLDGMDAPMTTIHRSTLAEDRSPSAHFNLGGLSLWSYEPATFQQLARAFTELATQLEAAQQPALATKGQS